MEGTHCTLQLQKPITELCYISFYLPRGEVRGFSYKGTVTLDRSNKGFHSCYQVREGADIISLSQQPSEHPGDIFFKQTPTKDILTELYKLTAERERLLADLLSSDHILGITMGNQEGKLQELSVSLGPEDNCLQSAGTWRGELPGGSLNKRSSHGNKKPRRPGGRRELVEALPQKRTRRKGRGDQESAPRMGKDQICSNNSLPLSRARPHVRLLEERGNLLPNGTLMSSLQRTESCPSDSPRPSDADLGSGNSGMVSEDTGLRRGALPPDPSSPEKGSDCVLGLPRRPHGLKHLQTGGPEHPQDPEKRPDVERGRRVKSTERTCRKRPVSKVVAKVQDLSAQVQRVVKPRPDVERGIAVCQAAQAEFIPKAGAPGSRPQDKEQQGDGSLQHSAGERTPISNPPASAEGAVNKVLLKVIESEKLDEATEGKRLGFPLSTRVTPTPPGARRRRKAELPSRAHKSLFPDLPCSVAPDSSQSTGDERKPSAPGLAAPSMVLNNSSPESSTHRRPSPAPLPLSPRLPSPREHHRILRLPSQPGEREAAFNDTPGGKSGVISGSPSADTLEPPSSAKVTETNEARPASLRAGPPQLLPGEPLEKSVGPGKTTVQPQHPGFRGQPLIGNEALVHRVYLHSPAAEARAQLQDQEDSDEDQHDEGTAEASSALPLDLVTDSPTVGIETSRSTTVSPYVCSKSRIPIPASRCKVMIQLETVL
ncbi:Formin-1 [Tupaia chinensis]|uniref:Formin-1 n=1 Tax=Tupaia chinensis TaxID=246437 RepID=L9L8B9_TUPCH|nr:Formin-1 [Tupaia chinensis]